MGKKNDGQNDNIDIATLVVIANQNYSDGGCDFESEKIYEITDQNWIEYINNVLILKGIFSIYEPNSR